MEIVVVVLSFFFQVLVVYTEATVFIGGFAFRLEI